MKIFVKILGLSACLSCFSLILFAAEQKATLIVDVHQVAGKNEKEIEKILGKPKSCKKTQVKPGLNGNSCSYAKNEIEIIFIKGKADWITISQMGDAKYDKNSLQLLGLKVKSPDVSNENVMRWNKIEGIEEIDFFPGEKKQNFLCSDSILYSSILISSIHLAFLKS